METIDKTIEELKAYHHGFTGYAGDFQQTIDNAIKALEQEPRWIPVSERLPEENGYYLTTTMYHEVYCDCWEEERFNRTEAVIAWMPLPKPYEPQESEDKE